MNSLPSRQADTLWLSEDLGIGTSFMLLSDTSAVMVDSQAHRRVAERYFTPVRPESDGIDLSELQAALQDGAYLMTSEEQRTTIAVLDAQRAVVSDGSTGYRDIVPYYLVRIAGGAFLVLDHGIGLTRVQVTETRADSISGFLYGTFGGPVTLRRLPDPTVDMDLLRGSWESVAINSFLPDRQNLTTLNRRIKTLTITDSTVAYRSADHWIKHPFRLIESTGMVILPDDRVWLVDAVTDSILKLLPDRLPPYQPARDQGIFFRRLIKNMGPTRMEPSGCSTEFLNSIADYLSDLGDNDIASFLAKPPAACPTNVEYAEWYNELLFTVLATHPESFRVVFRSLPANTQQSILDELRQPVHDRIYLPTILAAYRKIPSPLEDPIADALLAALKR